MATTTGEAEKQPLQQGQEETDNSPDPAPQNSTHDPNQSGRSLIHHEDETVENDLVSPYSVDPAMVSNAYENPYKETTDTQQNFIRRVPSSDLVPAPFKKFNHVIILAVVSAVFFVFTGVFAVRLAKNAKMHHNKGLYGLAQRDSRKATILSYLSLTLGGLLIITIIILASSIL